LFSFSTSASCLASSSDRWTSSSERCLFCSFSRFVPLRIAPLRFALLRFAQVRFASGRSAPLRSGRVSACSFLHLFQASTPWLIIARCFSFAMFNHQPLMDRVLHRQSLKHQVAANNVIEKCTVSTDSSSNADETST